MSSILLFLGLFASSLALDPLVTLSTVPFCKVCNCSSNQDFVDVDCSKSDLNEVTNLIFENTTYKSSEGFLYPLNLLNLSSLNFGQLKGVFPDSSLKILDLSNAHLEDIQNEAFKNLANLSDLVLSDNLLAGKFRPEIFKGLQMDGEYYPLQITKLFLDSNGLRKINIDDFEFFEKTLEVLSLAGNPLQNFDAGLQHAILDIVNLRELDLSYTQISRLPENFLYTPHKLKNLNLKGNQIKNLNWLSLEDSSSLEILTLNENPLQNISTFPKIPTLKILHLCNMPNLTFIGNNTFGQLQNLQELHLAHNPKLSHIAESALEYLQDGKIPELIPLKKLFINDNALKDLTLEAIWQDLEDFDITQNPWTCACQNQVLLDTVIPLYAKINVEQAKSLICGGPIEMQGLSLYGLYSRESQMRCEDLYGHRPEFDGYILIGVLAGSLFVLLTVLVSIHSYNRNWYGVFDPSPASFSRQFYRRTHSMDEDF